MGRRRLVVLFSAVVMLLIGVGLVGALVAATQSEGGRDWIRRQVARQLQGGLKGTVHLGRLSGSFLTDITFDSLRIKGPDDSVFVATGPVHLTYDPRDLFDGRIIVRSADVQHPFVVMRRENDDRWNFRRVFPVEGGQPSTPLARRAFGAVVVFHNVRIHGGHFQLTLPWQPDDSLRGARRDSAITANLAVDSNEIRRVVLKGVRGLQRTWRWTDWNATLTRVRFRQPDSTGRQFDVARMDVLERVPPFSFRNMRGGFLWRGDTIRLDFPHFELPGSVARGAGTIIWGDDRPIRYDVKVHSDSVALADVAWIHHTLPRSGGGLMDLHIRNERDLRVLDYAITNMDVRTHRSHLRGSMTYGVGGPVLLVKDVDLTLSPVDFELLETLNGAKFPLPWRGAFTGRVRARGGPVNHFSVDEAMLSFVDANVAGATAQGTGSGELDILSPSLAAFHGFRLQLAHFDLRSAQFVNPSFPRLNGVLAGSATLDSVWTDVRFRDADVDHRDGDSSAVSRFKGGGRITLGEDNVAFDVALAALPLATGTIAQSYPHMPLRGNFSGPIRANGVVSGFSITADLVGDAGRMQVEGTVDALAPRYRTTARGSLSDFDVQRAIPSAGWPATDFHGRFSVNLEGDSVANLFGTAQVVADRSLVDGVRVHAAQVGLRFAGGLVRVDSARIESVAGLLVASGALGLTQRRRDSLAFRVTADSLGGWRRYLGERGVARASGADSLDGTVHVTGTLDGSVKRYSLEAELDATDLRAGALTVRTAHATARVDALPDSARGSIAVRLDTLRTDRLAFDEVTVRADFPDPAHARASVSGITPLAARVLAHADLRRAGDSTFARFDSLEIRTSVNAWSLAKPAGVRAGEGGLAIDSLVLLGRGSSTLAVTGRLPADSGLALDVRAEAVPLSDIGEGLGTARGLEGTASLRAELRGSRARPDLAFHGAVTGALVAGLRLDRLTADGRYAARRLSTSLEYARLGVPALRAQATLPIDLAFQPAGPRLLEEPLNGRVRTDSAGLALLETLSKSVSGAKGTLAFDLDVAGTWRHPRLTGALEVRDGALQLAPMGNVKLAGLEADISFLGDSVVVRRVAVHSGVSLASSAELAGYVGIRDVNNPTFDLRLTAQGFNVVNRIRLADLDLTGDLRLTGAYDAATLTGSLTVDRGSIYVPELYQKRVISLDDPELYRVVDTSAFVDDRLGPDLPPRFVDNLTVASVPVRVGRDVWLRSDEANINLGGLVRITRGRVLRGPRTGQIQLGLEGTLQTVRGTYRLNLGPVQRPFAVESGEMRFFGDPDLDATLNINALHTVRQFSQQTAHPDVRVRVHIGGTRLSPTAELSSPDSVRVTNADLISYLVTGGPSYEISGRNGDYTSAAARVLLSSSFSVLAAKATGRLCDDAQLSAAGLLEGYQQRIRELSGSILSGTRFNCAKQVSEKAFVRLDYGFCQVGQLLGGNAATDFSIADALGIKLDYRLTDSYTASVGMDPPTSAVLCSRDANARGFAPTPRQFGLDLFRLWRF